MPGKGVRLGQAAAPRAQSQGRKGENHLSLENSHFSYSCENQEIHIITRTGKCTFAEECSVWGLPGEGVPGQGRNSKIKKKITHSRKPHENLLIFHCPDTLLLFLCI